MTTRASWTELTALRERIGRAPQSFDTMLDAWPIDGFRRLVVDRHEEAPRCYHDLRHIRENWRIVLEEGWFDRFADRQIELFAADAFHDIVYWPGAKSNEALSAEEFSRHHPDEGAGDEWSNSIHKVILATHDHLSDANASLPDWGRLFLDVDLFHLASGPEIYAEAGRRLMTEFSAVFSLEEILSGRLNWLNDFLERPRIYWLMTDREDAARRNLEADRANLRRNGIDALQGVV